MGLTPEQSSAWIKHSHQKDISLPVMTAALQHIKEGWTNKTNQIFPTWQVVDMAATHAGLYGDWLFETVGTVMAKDMGVAVESTVNQAVRSWMKWAHDYCFNNPLRLKHVQHYSHEKYQDTRKRMMQWLVKVKRQVEKL